MSVFRIHFYSSGMFCFSSITSKKHKCLLHWWKNEWMQEYNSNNHTVKNRANLNIIIMKRDRAFYDITTATNDTWLSVCSANQDGQMIFDCQSTRMVVITQNRQRQWHTRHTDSGIPTVAYREWHTDRCFCTDCPFRGKILYEYTHRVMSSHLICVVMCVCVHWSKSGEWYRWHICNFWDLFVI